MTFARDETNKECRVRTAHADFQREIKRVRGSHPTNVRTLSCGPMALALGHPVGHPGPAPHSREGGNLYGSTLPSALVSLDDHCPVKAKWIPAFAGMTQGKACLSPHISP